MHWAAVHAAGLARTRRPAMLVPIGAAANGHGLTTSAVPCPGHPSPDRLQARAKNGTGKTAAFCIPVLEKVDTSKNEVQGERQLWSGRVG